MENQPKNPDDLVSYVDGKQATEAEVARAIARRQGADIGEPIPPPPAEMMPAADDSPRIQCVFCPAEATMANAPDAGWEPYFWYVDSQGRDHQVDEAVCPECIAKHLEEDPQARGDGMQLIAGHETTLISALVDRDGISLISAPTTEPIQPPPSAVCDCGRQKYSDASCCSVCRRATEAADQANGLMDVPAAERSHSMPYAPPGTVHPLSFDPAEPMHGCASTRAACQPEGDHPNETPCSCACHNAEAEAADVARGLMDPAPATPRTFASPWAAGLANMAAWEHIDAMGAWIQSRPLPPELRGLEFAGEEDMSGAWTWTLVASRSALVGPFPIVYATPWWDTAERLMVQIDPSGTGEAEQLMLDAGELRYTGNVAVDAAAYLDRLVAIMKAVRVLAPAVR